MTAATHPLPPHTLSPDVLVLGASLGGVLAAWQASRAGASVCLVAQHAWLGGQMTAQAVPPDEHSLIEQGGASASYLAFREDIRALMRGLPGFLDRATLTSGTNPGDGWVSRLCFEPVHAARWFEQLLAPQVRSGQLRVLRLAQPLRATRQGRRIVDVTVVDAAHSTTRIEAKLFIDATDTGELLRLADVPYRLGKEAAADFNEPDAPALANRLDQQPITHVLALRWGDQPGPVLAQPAAYGLWRIQGVPQHAHRLFSECLPGRERGTSARLPFSGSGQTLDWWRYRRVVSAAQWNGPLLGQPIFDVSLVNWAQNDFALQPLLDGPVPMTDVLAQAQELSLCLMHWLQTEAPRPEGGHGFPEWQPATDVLSTADGLAQQAYVRESRRIVARSTLSQRELLAGDTAQRADSAGVAWYNLDIHPTCVSGHSVNARVAPFTLPLGAFIPVDVDNLLPGCKNLGVTHLANACTRVHPVEWLIGEVAGVMAARSVAQGCAPAALLDSPQHQAALQTALRQAGVPLTWSDELLRQAAAVGVVVTEH